MTDSTQRFSDRVDSYIRWRPGYPAGLFEILARDAELTAPSIVADIGSGTGISADLFLRREHTVYGVEPNAEMRQAAERLLAHDPRFHSVSGTAEATTLPAASVQYVVAAQAFHWFNPQKCRTEFQRILEPRGWCVLIWNSRRLDSTPFLRRYEALLNEFGTDYREVQHTNIDQGKLRAWFAPGTYIYRTLYNEQRFDCEGLRGRVLSSSYAPPPGHPLHEPLMRGLEHAFQTCQQDGQICFEYDTEIHIGKWN